MFETTAVVMSSGTGTSPLAPLCAIDEAMHPQQQLNYHQVTSLLPAFARVYRLKDGIPLLELDGAHVPAVMRWKTSRRNKAVCAGVAVAVPAGGRTGVVYHDAGRYGPNECKDRLTRMITAAMKLRGIQEFTCHFDVAYSAPAPHGKRGFHAALASVVYLDGPLYRYYHQSEALIEP